MKRILLVAVVLVLSTIACATGPATPRKLNLYPSPTSDATQTPVVVTVVNTKVVQITSTPVPSVTSTPVRQLCVSATETVNLRPSASDDGYPITQLENGVKVVDLGGRDGDWLFIQWKDKQGWINGTYLEECE